VMNKQREIIYAQRRKTMEGELSRDDLFAMFEKLLESIVAAHTRQDVGIEYEALISAFNPKFGLHLAPDTFCEDKRRDVREELLELLQKAYAEKEKSLGPDMMRDLERMVFMQVIDSKWKDHLYAMDSLREGIGLRAYGQRDPLIEYKREAFSMFSEMIDRIEEEALELLFRVEPARSEQFRGVFSSLAQEMVHPEAARPQSQPRPQAAPPGQPAPQPAPPPPGPSAARASSAKVGRNDPCPCGSGRKYKKCCGS
ncbi:MAG: SEC-C domain-containing protein, partial [Candidatus Omnitrophica bacterium]|nr:SEC-C domain-containing protein [Candidatus Omnitrophota bacterium]